MNEASFTNQDEKNEENNLIISKFAETHYIKNFHKKYKNAWPRTFNVIKQIVVNLDNIIGNNSLCEVVSRHGNITIVKIRFKIIGTNESPKSSGCRIIASTNSQTKTNTILLVYHKSHADKNSETSWWKNLIAENFDECRFLK